MGFSTPWFEVVAKQVEGEWSPHYTVPFDARPLVPRPSLDDGIEVVRFTPHEFILR